MMGRKGQASVEFLLLLLIMLLYVQLIIYPSIEISADAAEDVMRVGETRFAAEKLANAVDYVASSPGESVQTITLFLPLGGKISCNETPPAINFSVTVKKDSSAIANCTATYCAKQIALLSSMKLNCGSYGLELEGPVMAAVKVERKASGEVQLGYVYE